MTECSTTETIFFSALEKATPAERSSYLDEACAGEEGLRRQVERLIACHMRSEKFLERPVVEAAGLAAIARPETDLGEGAVTEDASGPDRLDFLAPSDRSDALGRLAHYEVLEIIGRGGMGIVLRAFDEKLKRVVALKALAPALATSAPARERFVREARATAAVTHDNVIAIYAVEDDGAVPYLVMPFIDGPNLQQMIDRQGPLPTQEVLRIGWQIASGLAAAHASGLVHRDIKPANILLENGALRVKITDFGLAQSVGALGTSMSGMIVGTPSYMSPEQAAGESVDHRSDLFSLGSVLHTLCAGRAPFRAGTTKALLQEIRAATAPRLREIRPELPDWLDELVGRLHAKRPADRLLSAEEVAEALGRGLSGAPAAVSIPTARTEPGPLYEPPALESPGRARPSLTVLTGLMLVVLGAGGWLAETWGVTDLRGAVNRMRLARDTGSANVHNPPAQSRQAPDPATASAAWEESVAQLPAQEQVEAVERRLRELNPEFNGKVESTIDNGVVIWLGFLTDRISDISPVRALKGLQSLDCSGSSPRKGRLSDLTPLRGLRLTRLKCADTQVSDLEPLRGMPMRKLHFEDSAVASLSPVEGMELEFLTLQRTAVSDLKPLRGMPLRCLDLFEVRGVGDLSPLEGMPLAYLNVTGLPVYDVPVVRKLQSLTKLILDSTLITDLESLRGRQLETLSFVGTGINDMSPLAGMPLTMLRLDYRPDRAQFLRSLKTLKFINERPTEIFWKEVDGNTPRFPIDVQRPTSSEGSIGERITAGETR